MDGTQKNELENVIREDMEVRRVTDDFPDFGRFCHGASDSRADASLRASLDQALGIMNRIKINIAYRPLKSNHFFFGPFIIFFKKAVRKTLLKWYVEPICFQQSDFNQAVTKSIESVRDLYDTEIAQQEAIGNHIKQQLMETSERIEALEASKRIQALETSEQIHILEQTYANIQNKIDVVEETLEKFKMLGFDLPESTNHYRYTSSQSGEDSIVRYLLGGMGISAKDCTYIDLGANHAIELSNTYGLYRQGARGVLVEPNPSLIPELQLYRGQDTILQRCVSDRGGQWADFYEFKEDGLSTTKKEEAEHCQRVNDQLHLQNIHKIETITVEEIIHLYLKSAPVLLDLDIEGYELQILRSIDFKKYRPAIIIVETIPYQKTLVIERKNNEIIQFMKSKEYVEYAFTGINSIFIDTQKIL